MLKLFFSFEKDVESVSFFFPHCFLTSQFNFQLQQGGASVEFSDMASKMASETTVTADPSAPTKVSSISTTNENKGSITRSHEVPGNSSTDDSSSVAGKSGGLSLDVLTKAKITLQKKKELAEKMKKIQAVSIFKLLCVVWTFMCIVFG